MVFSLRCYNNLEYLLNDTGGEVSNIYSITLVVVITIVAFMVPVMSKHLDG